MTSIVVTGASGAVGKRVVQRTSATGTGASPSPERLVAIARDAPSSIKAVPGVESHKLDLSSDSIGPAFEGCSTVVHLAEDRRRRTNSALATRTLHRVLEAAAKGGCQHFVFLSSALVYGAHADNPVPLTEAQPLRTVEELAHAVIKADLERECQKWAEAAGIRLTILRPAATLAEEDSSWIGSALRAAASVRPDQLDPPMQFLHQDDLAEAISFVVAGRHEGIYNVAPDGWIDAEVFRALRGEAEIRMPQMVGELRLRAAKAVADRTLLDGLEPYLQHPWVVANDKLRALGWRSAKSNEEVYVEGSSSPLLSSIGPHRKQEIALGVLGTAGASALGVAVWLARRSIR